jgi:outer membrane protein assembly factor BamB
MKRYCLIFTLLILCSCSFDNKTGLWRDASDIPVDSEVSKSIEGGELKSIYEDVLTKQQTFNEEIDPLDNLSLDFDTPISIANWTEEFGTSTNNISNISYSENNNLLSKSRKLSKFSSGDDYLNRNIIFYNNSLISYDHKGKIFVYSLNLKQKTFEFDFYKKNFKNIKKKIYLIVDKDILYVSDNLGYIYAINLKKNSLTWAKNFGIPFRSNLKVKDDQLFLANQDNVIFSIKIKNGEKKWEFATSNNFLKSDFKNNFAIEIVNNNMFFLNTSGELYSISLLNQKINWIYNFKAASLGGDTDLFLSQPIVLKKNNIVISTEKTVFQYNSLSGIKNWTFPSGSILKPVLTTNYTYVLSKNNLLVCIENKTGKVLWSKNIFQNTNIKNIKKKIGKLNSFKIINNNLNLFSSSGYLLNFNYIDGNLNFIKRISKKGISSEIVFLEDNMFFIDNNNKLLKFN